jgi:hypothetical protein
MSLSTVPATRVLSTSFTRPARNASAAWSMRHIPIFTAGASSLVFCERSTFFPNALRLELRGHGRRPSAKASAPFRNGDMM